jgi:4-hydroxybenzoate polyprenyltransferase
MHARQFTISNLRVNSLYHFEGVKKMGKILRIIIVALIAFWLLGFVMKVGGGLIHLLLVIAGIIFVIQLLTGRRSV